MQNIVNLIDKMQINNTTKEIIIALIMFAISAAILKIIEFIVVKKWKTYTKKTKNVIDDLAVYLIERSIPFLYIAAIYIALYQIHFASSTEKIVTTSLKVITSIYIIFILIIILDWFVTEFVSNNKTANLRIRSLKGATKILKLVVYSCGIILILDNLGINVTALVTGLGITGIAVALAAQKILGDLFNYFVIIFDKPFEEGDFIAFGNSAGTVERIGLKSTRIRSLSGEEIVISNTNLINEEIQNYKRMKMRRVVFKTGVTYETKSTKLKKIPEMIKNIIGNIKGAVFDRCHFVNLSDFSLDFETVYYVEDSDYLHYMNIHQQINLALIEKFHKEEIEFAYPTQIIYLNNNGGNNEKK